MAQNISATNAFATNYEVGVPSQSDPANIVQAFTEYHYGPGYTGVGAAAGMEGHLKDLADDITTASGLVPTHSALTSGVHGVTGTVVGTGGTQILTQKTLTSPVENYPVITAPTEKIVYSAGATAASVNVYVESGAVYYYGGAGSAAYTLNIKYNAGTNLSTWLAQGYATNVTFITVETTARDVTTVNIDGAAQTVLWADGYNPVGNANSTNVWSFNIIRTGASTYVVLGSCGKYA